MIVVFIQILSYHNKTAECSKLVDLHAEAIKDPVEFAAKQYTS